MDPDVTQYGLWLVAILNAAMFIVFAVSFFKPSTLREWRSLAPRSEPRMRVPPHLGRHL